MSLSLEIESQFKSQKISGNAFCLPTDTSGGTVVTDRQIVIMIQFLSPVYLECWVFYVIFTDRVTPYYLL